MRQELPCVVRLDRVQLVVPRPLKGPLPTIRDYRILKDTFVRSQTNVMTYARCRQLVHLETGTKLYIQYQKQKAWLAGWKVTLVANDRRGLNREDLDPVLARCRMHRLLMAEVAFDFSPESGVDLHFVKGHGLFGKSRRRFDRGGQGELRFGSRKSGKLVRCYPKAEIDAFRVEIEIHSRLLRANQVTTVDDMWKLAVAVVPDHIRFVRVSWKRLRRHLMRKFGRAKGRRLHRETRERAYSIHRLCRYLRNRGVHNVHRFLVEMAINNQLRRALGDWKVKISNGIRWTRAA